MTEPAISQEPRSEADGPRRLTPIKNGWAAFGDGWAVHGRTQEEAIQRYRESLERNARIAAHPRRIADDDAEDADPQSGV